MENLSLNFFPLCIISTYEPVSESNLSYYGYPIAKVLCEVPAEAERAVLWTQSNFSVKYDLLLRKRLKIEHIIQSSKSRT
jgi:hypothetical protein